MIVTTETATVYRSGARRFLSKNAAYRAAAWALIRERRPCGCEHEVGFLCGNHRTPEDEERMRRLHARLVRMFKRADRVGSVRQSEEGTSK